MDAVRNGSRAIELATRACEATEYKAAHILSTLAAAYAEVGDFENAKKWSQKAIDLSEESIKEQLRDELKHYEEGKPFRESQEIKEKDPADLEDFGDQDLKLDASADESAEEESDK
jgi:mannose/cellobiose epimerase-like protein (N-acyl-D-glucosamine 2-epimerase family)